MNNLAGTIAELHTAFQSGLSLSEAMAAHLRTVNAIKSLNAFTGVAENADMKPLNKSGRLNGVPMAVKDNFCTRDFPTTCASAMLRDYQPPFNATVVEKAKQAGAVILGKTNLDEFAMGSGGLDSIYGPAKSIWKSSIPYRLRNKNGCVVHESKSSKVSVSNVFDPLGQSTVMAGNDHCCQTCLSVRPHFSNSSKAKQFSIENKYMFVTMDMAEGIIDDTCLVIISLIALTIGWLLVEVQVDQQSPFLPAPALSVLARTLEGQSGFRELGTEYPLLNLLTGPCQDMV